MASQYPRGMSGINEFKQHFTSVRPTLFRVSIQKPAGPFFDNSGAFPKGSDSFYFYAKATTLPASKIAPIEVGFMGRKFYEHGDREFDPWTISIYNSQDFAIRHFFEGWMDQMNLHEDNKQTSQESATGGYFTGGTSTLNESSSYYGYFLDLKVEQLDRRNTPIYTYTMVNAFPTECSEIQLDYTQNNTIEEFNVTFQYQYWTSYNELQETKVIDYTGGGERGETELGFTGLGV